MGAIQPWKITDSKPVADCRVFKVRKDVTVSPRTGQAHDMYVIENPNWLNVVPLTPDEQVVLVEQWRHGTRSVHWETPGGLMDPGETVEQCARRELLEETGYQAESIVPLGKVHANPAIQDNIQFYALAANCRKIAEPAPDDAEDIRVHLVPLKEIPAMIRSGKISHALVVEAFYWLELYRQGRHG